MMMKLHKFGRSKLVSRKIESSEEIWQIIFGRWVFLVPVDHVLKSILTAVLHMAKRVVPSPTKIDTLRFGTLFLCKMFVVREGIRTPSQLWESYRQRILIQDWVWKELQHCCKVLKIFMRLILQKSFLIRPQN